MINVAQSMLTMCLSLVVLQRIERWWGILRQMNAQFWINLFKDMDEAGLFVKGEEVHR